MEAVTVEDGLARAAQLRLRGNAAVPRGEDPAGGELERFAAELAAQLPLPPGVEPHLHQDLYDERYVVLPQAPHEMDALTEEELKSVVGGLVFNGGNGGTGEAGGNGGPRALRRQRRRCGSDVPGRGRQRRRGRMSALF